MANKESLIVELDTRTGKAEASIKSFDKSVDALDSSVKSVDKSLSNVNETNIKLSKTAAGVKQGVAGIGRSAGQAGIQLQQFVGQVQGGQSAMLALSQQSADLGFVLGAPLVGAVVGISASIAGILLPNLFKANEALKDVTETSEVLFKNYEKLTRQQQEVAKASIIQQIREQSKVFKDLKSEVEELEEELALVEARSKRGGAGGFIMRAVFGGDGQDVQEKQDELTKAKSSLSVLGIEIKQLSENLGTLNQLDTGKTREEIESLKNQFNDIATLGQTSSDEGIRTGASLAIQNRLLSETEALSQRYERDKEILDLEIADIEERNATKLQLEQEYLENLERINKNGENERIVNAKKAAATEARIETMKASLASRTAQTLLSSSLSTQQKLFTIVKDAAAGQIEAYGLTAGARALAELGPIAGPPVSAQYIGWSQVAAGVVRALPLGGSGGSAGSPDGTSSSSQQPQQEFQPETSSLELTEQDEQGVSTQRLIISTEDGEDLLDALSKRMAENERQGR